ncbi:hypothetical protein LIER_38190 [Lithospermum erythrorhizon]|uniref:Zinc finger CCCH domain-containing protein 14 n=1 Tax=Lithospermum erythrorhizon TaxID=34254 RepID=A0AAV3PWE4_LITER
MLDDNTAANQSDDHNNPEMSDGNASRNQCEAPPNPQDVHEKMTLMSPQQPPRSLEFDKFMMSQFRIADCPPWVMQFYLHNPRLCPHVHPGKIQRRDPLCYTPEICPMIPNCEDYDECGFAHNIYEYCPHPKKFTRTRCYHGMNFKMYPCLFPHNSGQLFRDTAKPPLYPKPPPVPRPFFLYQTIFVCHHLLLFSYWMQCHHHHHQHFHQLRRDVAAFHQCPFHHWTTISGHYKATSSSTPILPLPDNFRLPPPAPIQLLDVVPPPPPPSTLQPAQTRCRRLPPLPFPRRRNDDELTYWDLFPE